MDPANTTTRFRGTLEGVRLLDVVQLCCRTVCTCCLDVKNGRQRGRLWLADGDIVHAETDGITGETAAIAILTWRYGDFAVQNHATPGKTSIASNWEELVMRAACVLDEHPAVGGRGWRPASRPGPRGSPPTGELGTPDAIAPDVTPARQPEPSPVGGPTATVAAAESRPGNVPAASCSPDRVGVGNGAVRDTAGEAPAGVERPECAPATHVAPPAPAAEAPNAWLARQGRCVYDLSVEIGQVLGLGLPVLIRGTGPAHHFSIEVDADDSARVSCTGPWPAAAAGPGGAYAERGRHG
jgi:hypothetical protein